MDTQGAERGRGISLISVAVGFGSTQVVVGNCGVPAILKKSPFAS